MKKAIIWLAMLALVLPQITGCAGTGDTFEEYKKPGIIVLGAAAGGLVGSLFGEGTGQKVAIVGGAVAGGALGYWIAEKMEDDDREVVNYALENYEDGETLHWKNSGTDEEYAVTPTRTFFEDGRKCREFEMTRFESGTSEESSGKACRQSDGQWQIIT